MGALPKALSRRGHRVMVVAPRYGNYAEGWETGVRRQMRVFGGDQEVVLQPAESVLHQRAVSVCIKMMGFPALMCHICAESVCIKGMLDLSGIRVLSLLSASINQDSLQSGVGSQI